VLGYDGLAACVLPMCVSWLLRAMLRAMLRAIATTLTAI